MTTSTTFQEFNLGPSLIEAIEKAGFTSPTPIQEQSFPILLEGHDLFAQAETGSGKTAAFAIPVLHHLMGSSEPPKTGTCLVLSPTRELAQQTFSVFEVLAKGSSIDICCLIGGESMERQKELLRSGAGVVVATPGRLVDLVKQKQIDLSRCQYLVFDEADRLFDMGFQTDIEFLLKKIPQNRQLIMVSATGQQEVLRTAYRHHSSPKEVILNQDRLVVDHIDHKLAMLAANEKMRFLIQKIRHYQDAYALVFCNTQFTTHLVAEWLRAAGFSAQAISGRLNQSRRSKLMQDFRDRKSPILVCTDVAARGLDIKDVNLVINYDLPQEAANYVHRIGRTGRAGASGEAVSLCAFEDCENLEQIYEYIDAKIPKLEVTDEHFAESIPPKPNLDQKTLKLREDKRPERSQGKRSERNKKERVEERTPKQPKRTHQESKTKKEESMKRPESTTRERANKRIDKRAFEITTTSLPEASAKAKNFFGLSDDSLLKFDVLSEGKKKFLLFGPRETRYRFTVKPFFKKLLTPLLVETIKRAELDLFVRISYKAPQVNITYTGDDGGLLLTNRKDLMFAFEQICRTYLANKIYMPAKLRFSSRFVDEKRQEEELLNLAEKSKKQVLETEESVTLRPLNPAERRLIHQHLGEDNEVMTSSIGEGKMKRIEISLRPN